MNANVNTSRRVGTIQRLLATSGSAAAVAICLSQPALAGEVQPAESSAGLEEIVVQARKIDENLQDIPVAVTAFSGEEIRQQNLQVLQDLSRFSPGLIIRQSNSSPNSIDATIRGQVQTDPLASLDASVGIYVDDLPWARSYGTNGDILDLRSIQVLKGPQGTLFGRNTTGGAIVIRTNDPDLSDFGGQASLTYGRFNEFQAVGILNLPVVTDKVAIRLAGSRLSRDGYIRNLATGSRLDNRDRWAFRGKLRIDPTENLRIVLSGEYFDADERAPARRITGAFNSYTGAVETPGTASPYNVGSLGSMHAGLESGFSSATATAEGMAILNQLAATLAANPNTIQNDHEPRNKARTQTYGVNIALTTDWGELRFIGGYRRVETISQFDTDGTQFNIHFGDLQQDLKQYSGELQITGEALGDRIGFAAGLFAFHEKGFDDQLSRSVPLLSPADTIFYGIINNDSIGVYGQASFRLTDRLTVTGGLRYSVDDKRLDNRNLRLAVRGPVMSGTTVVVPQGAGQCFVTGLVTTNIDGLNAPDCSVVRKDDFSAISYLASIDYQITDDILVYASTSRGYRSGGQALRALSAVSYIPFAPEFAYAHEIGLKSEFLDRRVRLNLAAYQTTSKDLQRTGILAVGNTQATVVFNAGKARFRGFEAELQALLFEGFRLSGNVAHVDAKYLEFSDLTGDRRFERFNAVSPWSWGIAGSYSRDIADGVGLNLRIDYSWQSATPTDFYNDPRNPQNEFIVASSTAPAYGLLGARASATFADGMYELAVFGRNLTNNRDDVVRLLVAGNLGYAQGVPRQPRTYGVTGTVKF